MAQKLANKPCAGTSETDWRSILFLGGDKRGAYTPGFAAVAAAAIGGTFIAQEADKSLKVSFFPQGET